MDVDDQVRSTSSSTLTAAGAAALMISSDLPEVLGMSDRVVVMAQVGSRVNSPPNRPPRTAVMALAVSTPHTNGTGTEAPRGH
ncbi:Sugar ABC transporter ATP-binding protein OS=Streptomyces tendae OX=1932 GN=GUR47_08720 PE=4 SV=1 [Streptomyces tendae]